MFRIYWLGDEGRSQIPTPAAYFALPLKIIGVKVITTFLVEPESSKLLPKFKPDKLKLEQEPEKKIYRSRILSSILTPAPTNRPSFSPSCPCDHFYILPHSLIP